MLIKDGDLGDVSGRSNGFEKINTGPRVGGRTGFVLTF